MIKPKVHQEISEDNTRDKINMNIIKALAVVMILFAGIGLANAASCGKINNEIWCDGVRVVSNPLPTAFTEFVNPGWTPINPELYASADSQLIVPVSSFNMFNLSKTWYFNFSSPKLSSAAYYFSLTQADYCIESASGDCVVNPWVNFGDPYALNLTIDRDAPIQPMIVDNYDYKSDDVSNVVYYFKGIAWPKISAEAGSLMLYYVDGTLAPSQINFDGNYDPLVPEAVDRKSVV